MAKRKTAAALVRRLVAQGKLDQAQAEARRAIVAGEMSAYDYPMPSPPPKKNKGWTRRRYNEN
jgi:hypothetical protein